MHDIEKRTKEVVCQLLGVNEEDVNDSSNLQDDLRADSLDIVEVIMDLEHEFDIDIPDEDTLNFTTFGELVEYLKRRLPSEN